MPLHLQKLCVGAESIESLRTWISGLEREQKRLNLPLRQAHTTRMAPKRVDEILAGGSLYWVIKNQIACRQVILDIVPFTDRAGISRCDIVLERTVIEVEKQPKRPFQGWRYLSEADAPADLGRGALPADLPDHIRLALKENALL